MTTKNESPLAVKVDALTKKSGVESAIEYLNGYIDANVSDEALYLRGRLLWKLGRRTDAMSDYSAAVAINPQSEAAAALAMAQDVMNFFNPDLYNP